VSYTFVFTVITNTDVMVVESTGVAQLGDLVASINTENIVVQTSAGEPSAMKFITAPVAVEDTTIIVSEVLATTSVSKEPVVGLIPA